MGFMTEQSLRPDLARRNLADRRRSVRSPTDLQALVRTYHGTTDISWPAAVSDVSLHGVGLVLGVRYVPGTLLSVSFLSPTGAVTATKVVRVVHVRAHSEIETRLGCAFAQKLTNAELEKLSDGARR
jgi:hypothetical protein